MRDRLKNSIGVWAFGPNATRFVPRGYHLEAIGEDMVERTKRVCAGLVPYFDGLEFHYPGEVNFDNLPAIQRALKDHGMDLYSVPVGFHCMDEFHQGSFVNPDAKKRRLAVKLGKETVDLAKAARATMIIWPGGEGYNYPFQVDYKSQWGYLIENIGTVADYAAKMKVKVFLEHKNSEPAMNVYMRNIGMTLFLIQKIREAGFDTSTLSVNMDWQHLIMNGEPLAEYAALLMGEKKLGHLHANSGWGTFDDDNMTGSLNFMEAIAIAKELQMGGYGKKGERIGFDLYPYTEDACAAAVRSVKQWEFIYDVALAIPTDEFMARRRQRDAVGCYELVYAALGYDAKKIDALFKKR